MSGKNETKPKDVSGVERKGVVPLQPQRDTQARPQGGVPVRQELPKSPPPKQE